MGRQSVNSVVTEPGQGSRALFLGERKIFPKLGNPFVRVGHSLSEGRRINRTLKLRG